MTNKEFNEKWDDKAYNNMLANNGWDEYVQDCFDMYETEGFADTFESPYEEFKRLNGKKYNVVRRLTTEDGIENECLPMWLVEFENGERVICFPEEICLIERN